MQIGDFVKWTSTDESGTFSHRGQVIDLTDTIVVLNTTEGRMGVRLEDGKFTKTRKFDLPDVQPVVKPKARKTKSKKTGAAKRPSGQPREGSKLAQAIEIAKSLETVDRKTLIAAFVDQLGMTPAGASTYASNVKKFVGKD